MKFLFSLFFCVTHFSIASFAAIQLAQNEKLPSAATVVPPKGKPAEAVPQVDQNEEYDEEDYEYDPIGKRDPFKSFIKLVKPLETVAKTSKIVNKQKVEVVVTDPLLKYGLEEYKILGILSNTNNPRALIQIDGKTYIMYRNMKLGRNSGVIREIREGELVVSEQVEIDGKIRQETKLLQIK